MKELMALKAVYCYMFPETWECLEEVQKRITRDFFLRTTPSKEMTNIFSDLFNPILEFPSKKLGNLDNCLNLDELFIPISKRIVSSYKKTILGLENFENIYPGPGSSDLIFKALAYLKSQGYKKINVFESEYEGISVYGKNLGFKIIEHNLETINSNKKYEGIFYMSNPSSISGNNLPDELINNLLEAGNLIMFDFAYVGTTSKKSYDVNHKNVIGVFLSLSKPYGVFEERVTGFAFLKEKYFSKKETDNFLYGNRWFTDKVRTLQALKLVEELGPRKNGVFPLFAKYKKIQKEIVDFLIKEYNLPFKESDSFLLAYINEEDLKDISEEKKELIKDFKRGNNYRFCLTPYFEIWEKNNYGGYKNE